MMIERKISSAFVIGHLPDNHAGVVRVVVSDATLIVGKLPAFWDGLFKRDPFGFNHIR